MKIWKVYHDSTIEATSPKDAETKLIEQNSSVATIQYFADEKVAYAAYNAIELNSPVLLDVHLAHYDGKLIFSATDCDDDAETLEDGYYSGAELGGDCEIGGMKLKKKPNAKGMSPEVETLDEIVQWMAETIGSWSSDRQEEIKDCLSSYINDWFYDYELSDEDFEYVERELKDWLYCDE